MNTYDVSFAPSIRSLGVVADDPESRHSIRQRSTGSDPTLRSRPNRRGHHYVRSAAIRASRAMATRGCRSDERAQTR